MDACPGPCSSGLWTVLEGEQTFFVGSLDAEGDGIEGSYQLYRLDGGQPEKLTRLTAFLGDGPGGGIGYVAQVGSRLVFNAADAEHGAEPRAVDLAPEFCVPSAVTLCLGGGRFRAEVEWTDFSGGTGSGQANTLTKDSGSFWFFDPANLELVVKVIDGTAINGNHWVFFGSLSNVAFTLTVTDLHTGAEAVYANPSGRFASRGDTNALPSPAAGSKWDPVASSGASNKTAGKIVDLKEAAESMPSGACQASDISLCIGGRFLASVDWKDFQGGRGVGHALPLTDDTGGFWFFDSANVELMIKILDGTSINGSRWVFYGSLSDVEFDLTVVDTETGQAKVYRNESGTFASVGDLEAF